MKKALKENIRKAICFLLVAAIVSAFEVFFLPEESRAAFADSTVSRFTSKTYTQSYNHSNYIAVNGVDVSAYQTDVDWELAKADGIDFAIIRVGYTGYGTGVMGSDNMFEEHIRKAKAAGMMVGVYYFSQAVNTEEAIAEADFAIDLIEKAGYYPSQLELPVFMDYEKATKADGSGGRINSLSKSVRTQNTLAFMNEIEARGYKSGIYADYSFSTNSMDGSSISQKHFYWAAQYNSTNDFPFDYGIWQYTSSGHISGFLTSAGKYKSIDTNYLYLNPRQTSTVNPTVSYEMRGISPSTYGLNPYASVSITECDVMLSTYGDYTYSPGMKYEPPVTVYYGGRVLNEGVDYKVNYISNAQAGTAYALVTGLGFFGDYMLKNFTINKSYNTSAVTVSGLKNSTYNGKNQAPSTIVVKESTGRILKEGIDYSFATSGAVDVGTATATITFLSDYVGSKTETYSITKGKQTLTIDNPVTSLAPADGEYGLRVKVGFSGDTLTYSSSDESVAVINSKGVITPISGGETTITIKSAGTSNYSGAEYSFNLSVKNPPQTVETPFTRYTRDELGSSINLRAKTNGDGEFFFSSNNEEVAKVDESGRVSIIGAGEAEITVTAAETDAWEQGSKTVYVTVAAIDPDIKQVKYENILEAVENTKITSLTAVAQTSKKVKLNWKKSKAKYGVDYFQVFRSTKKSSGYTKIFTTADGKTYQYINSKGMVGDTLYWFKVRGVRNVAGQKIYTEFKKVSVKTLKKK